MMRTTAATAALLTLLTTVAAAQRGPAPTNTGLSADVLAMACSPSVAYELPDRSLRVTGGQDTIRRRTWAPGDLITINGGTDNGIDVGQEYFIRRVQVENTEKVTRATPASIRTAGWLRVYAVDREMSLATIVHACDTIEVNDYLEPFALPKMPTPVAEIHKPQRGNYGRIMFGNDQRRAFGKGDFFIIDRGSDHGVAPGDRFVVYRDKMIPENFLYHLGEAVVVSVTPETSTLQATVSRDAFLAGDYVAPRKAPATR